MSKLNDAALNERIERVGREAVRRTSPGRTRFVASVPSERRYGNIEAHDAFDYTCKLRCLKCYGTTREGRGCTRSTCKYLPLCWQHLRSMYWLTVRRTELVGANGRRFDFDGVFIDRPRTADGEVVFRTGERVAVYFGDVLTDEELRHRYGTRTTAPYALQLRQGLAADAACVRSIGSLANTMRSGNTSRLGQRRNNARFNATSSTYPDISFIVATSIIRQGDELLVSYGASYRFDVPHN